jgi:WhiB family transcriptional regulator, redox-sensing transcriptional regulator
MSDQRLIERGRGSTPVLRSWRWQADAACSAEPSDLFFGPDGEKPVQRTDREERALAICARCPVREPCQNHAVGLPETYGVWGGTTEAVRVAIRRSQFASPAA